MNGPPRSYPGSRTRGIGWSTSSRKGFRRALRRMLADARRESDERWSWQTSDAGPLPSRCEQRGRGKETRDGIRGSRKEGHHAKAQQVL